MNPSTVKKCKWDTVMMHMQILYINSNIVKYKTLPLCTALLLESHWYITIQDTLWLIYWLWIQQKSLLLKSIAIYHYFSLYSATLRLGNLPVWWFIRCWVCALLMAGWLIAFLPQSCELSNFASICLRLQLACSKN